MLLRMEDEDPLYELADPALYPLVIPESEATLASEEFLLGELLGFRNT